MGARASVRPGGVGSRSHRTDRSVRRSIDRSIGETEPETETETETRRDDDDDDDGAPAVERHCAAASTPALGDGDDDASERDAPYQPVRRIPDECLAREELGEARDATGGGDGGRERGFQSVGSSDEEREAHGYQEDYDLGRGTDRDWTGERRHARPRGGADRATTRGTARGRADGWFLKKKGFENEPDRERRRGGCEVSWMGRCDRENAGRILDAWFSFVCAILTFYARIDANSIGVRV